MKKRISCKLKSFAGWWAVCGRISKSDRTVRPSFRGKIMCLSSSGALYYANVSEVLEIRQEGAW